MEVGVRALYRAVRSGASYSGGRSLDRGAGPYTEGSPGGGVAVNWGGVGWGPVSRYFLGLLLV